MYFCIQCSSNYKRALLFDGFHGSAICPSGKKNTKVEMFFEQWWHSIDKGKLNYWEENFPFAT
jgi:hypothetical protein